MAYEDAHRLYLSSTVDLKNIYEYIAYLLLVPDTARSMYQKIIQGACSLETMPECNQSHAFFRGKGYQLSVGRNC